VVDPTFVIRRFGNGQKLSFHTFAFVHDYSAKLFLHCDVIACLPQADCGECSNKTGGKKRARRHAKLTQRIEANAVKLA